MENPYQTTTTNPVNTLNQTGDLSATPKAIEHLIKSKSWIRFISVILFLWCTLYLLGGMSLLFMAPRTEIILMFPILVTFITTILLFVLGLRLSGYASAIRRLSFISSPQDLETAMVKQMLFWKLTGIMTLIMIIMGIISTILL